MCGRLACNLSPETYQKACSYQNLSENLFIQPRWICPGSNEFQFQPSNNICPSRITPVLVHGPKFDIQSSRCLIPMLWGMIPRWHKGPPLSHGISSSNCRIESIRESENRSKLYIAPLEQGKRCIVVCEGYYEWQTLKHENVKQPYYVYAKQEVEIKVEDVSSWNHDSWSTNKGWFGPKFLKLAAIYDVWENEQMDGEIYSYSIITVEADPCLSWLHHRMPAILETRNQVQDWLNSDQVSASRAVSMLTPSSNLSWHPVSTYVNNSRNKGPECNRPKLVKPPENSLLKNWLTTGVMKKQSRNNESDQTGEVKRTKM